MLVTPSPLVKLQVKMFFLPWENVNPHWCVTPWLVSLLWLTSPSDVSLPLICHTSLTYYILPFWLITPNGCHPSLICYPTPPQMSPCLLMCHPTLTYYPFSPVTPMDVTPSDSSPPTHECHHLWLVTPTYVTSLTCLVLFLDQSSSFSCLSVFRFVIVFTSSLQWGNS